MIGIYNYTVILTYMAFSSGIFGIINACAGNTLLAIICLMVSGLCDMFDGKVARTKKDRSVEERHFGIQLDSLSDVVCFGVLPAIIGYRLGLREWYYLIIIVFFPLAALIRLAWFNVLEITRNSNTPVKFYTGLPVTSSALLFPLVYALKSSLGTCFTLVYGITLLVVGILFITKLKIKKPSTKTMIILIVLGVLELILIFVVFK